MWSASDAAMIWEATREGFPSPDSSPPPPLAASAAPSARYALLLSLLPDPSTTRAHAARTMAPDAATTAWRVQLLLVLLRGDKRREREKEIATSRERVSPQEAAVSGAGRAWCIFYPRGWHTREKYATQPLRGGARAPQTHVLCPSHRGKPHTISKTHRGPRPAPPQTNLDQASG